MINYIILLYIYSDADNSAVGRRHGISPTKETSPREEVQVKQEPV